VTVLLPYVADLNLKVLDLRSGEIRLTLAPEIGRCWRAFALHQLGEFVSAASHAAEESLSDLKVVLQILLTASVSAAGCERSYSQMNLIMTYLRSTLTESRLTNLAILSVDRQTVEQVDFTKVTENFAAARMPNVSM